MTLRERCNARLLQRGELVGQGTENREQTGEMVGGISFLAMDVSFISATLVLPAVAGALVLYDRLLQHGRFADRPVGSMGVAEALPATGHGAPRFRRTVPDWLHVDAKKP